MRAGKSGVAGLAVLLFTGAATGAFADHFIVDGMVIDHETPITGQEREDLALYRETNECVQEKINAAEEDEDLYEALHSGDFETVAGITNPFHLACEEEAGITEEIGRRIEYAIQRVIVTEGFDGLEDYIGPMPRISGAKVP